MKQIYKILFFIGVIHGVATNLLSQKLCDTITIEEIRVNSKRPLNKNSLTLTRIDSIIVQNKSTSSLSDLLSEHTGIFIKSYGRGALSSASFRGTDPSHTKVLWNGIELNSPMLGMVDFSILPMFFIDNVELLHGTSSISETSGALGGLINLSTEPSWNNTFSGSFTQSTGSFGTHDEHLRINAGNTKFQSQTRLFYTHSDNDFSFENHDLIDSVDLETGQKYFPVVNNENAWFSSYGVLQEIHYRPCKNDFISGSFWGQESSRSIPLLSTNESGVNNNLNRQVDNSIRSHLSYRHYGKKYTAKFFTGLNFMDLNYSFKNRLPENICLPIIDSKSRTSSLYTKANLQYIISQGFELELSTGVDFHKVESLEKIKMQGYNESQIQANFSASINKKWNERWKSSIKLGGMNINGKNSIPIAYAGGEFHILPSDRLFLKLILASNSRYPSLNELYYQPGGNPGLRPERSTDQEFGLHYQAERGNLSFSHDFSFYMSQVKDWIMWRYYVMASSPENVRRVDIKGMETNASLMLVAGKTMIKLSSCYSLAHSRDLGDKLNDSDLSYGKQLPYIPVHSANTMLYFLRNNWSFSYIWNYYSERYTTTSNQETSQGDCLYPYFMNQAGLGKQIQKGRMKFDLNLKVFNLFNEKYRSVLQRPMPGRNYVFQLKLNF